MASAPKVSYGWSAPFVAGSKKAVEAAAAAAKEAAPDADLGATWTNYTNVLGETMPAALRNARTLSGQMREAVR